MLGRVIFPCCLFYVENMKSDNITVLERKYIVTITIYVILK